jgi:hypothetical protein
MIDQVLGCLDVSRIQDSGFRQRLRRALDSGDRHDVPRPRRVETFTERLTLRDALGDDVHDALDAVDRTALDELRDALDQAERDRAGADELATLGAALLAIVTDHGDLDAEPIQELMTRAADRIAREPSTVPGNDLGELVVRLLLAAATDLTQGQT